MGSTESIQSVSSSETMSSNTDSYTQWLDYLEEMEQIDAQQNATMSNDQASQNTLGISTESTFSTYQ